MYIAGREDMRLLDAYTMEQLSLPGIVLMENAGTAVVNAIICSCPDRAVQVLVAAGGGNNGGDGFVIARRLIDYGYTVELWLAVPEERIKGDAKVHYDAYRSRKLPLRKAYEEPLEAFTACISEAGIIVDALLGTGASGEVRGIMADMIQTINASSAMVYAVDIPSGVDADSGAVIGLAVKADYTVTFVMPKKGFFLGSGPQYIGEWTAANISVPPSIVDTLGLKLPKLLDQEVVVKALPNRVPHGHKGTFGHCLVIGGSRSYVGAPAYTAKAAFYSGAGLVSMAHPDAIYSSIAAQCPECLLMPLKSVSAGAFFADDALDGIDWSKFKAIAFGPGLGREADGEVLLRKLLEGVAGQPVVVDADGLFYLAKLLPELNSFNTAIIATPHPGEMAQLMGTTVSEIESNRLQYAQQLASEAGIYVLLKGHRAIIASPDGELWMNPYGNDTLGKGGSGDVLTGLIASFCAQGAEPLSAMLAASYYHATAGEAVGEQISHYGAAPLDVVEHVRHRLGQG